MTSVAGVKFVDMWGWRCPRCSTRYVFDNERKLERVATKHFQDRHGTPDHPELELDFGAG